MILVSLAQGNLYAQESSPDLEEVNVFESLNSAEAPEGTADVNMSTTEEQDDLLSLKEDVGETVFEKEEQATATGPTPAPTADQQPTSLTTPTVQQGKAPVEPADAGKTGILNIVNPPGQTAEAQPNEKTEIIADESMNFDIGSEEKKLVELSKFVQAKISAKEWDDMAIKAKLEKYEVQKGD